jgi:acyl-CoA reductase-like NAD-dependent aldehyde dehydrogenase
MATSRKKTFDSINPVSGEVLATFPVDGKETVSLVVESAHEALYKWQHLGFKGRKKVLLDWSKYLVSHVDEIAELISDETGKPISDAKLEAALAINHIGWAARNAEYVMSPEHRSPGLIMANMSARVEHSPVGVVGVIGPWNYPIFTPLGSITYALAAGNAVVFKPSELTPAVGVWLADSFAQVAPSEEIFQVITGFGDTGQYLCESEINKLAFTGSTKTAKLVAATCAANMIPVVLECGGKDPVIIAADANLGPAVENTLWSAMSNAGQTCIGAERVYVDEKIADRFIELFVAEAEKITAGAPGAGNYGPATMPEQIDVIAAHIADALKRGGKALLGGKHSVQPPYVQPVVLVDVPEDAIAMTEETFGPVIIINRFHSIEHAVRLANASKYGLGASVWSKRQGKKIASQLHCGMVAINSTISFAAIPSVPFGGVKDSGSGRIHGPEGILEFTYPRTVVHARFQLPLVFTSFNRSYFSDKLIMRVIKILKGRLS